MPDTFAVTIIAIAVSTMVAAFVRRIKCDKCLKDFGGEMITLEKTAGQVIWGRLRVENTGLELVYDSPHADADGHTETSYILYRNEYPVIQAFIRFHDKLDGPAKAKRLKQLEKTYHPALSSRTRRKVFNIFRTVRDSIAEVVNLLISQAKKASPAGTVLSSQDKYVTQMKDNLMSTPQASYEPLLERYIGQKVVLEIVKQETILECVGILKDYTAEFIEIMDADYALKDSAPERADLIVPRKLAVVRHHCE